MSDRYILKGKETIPCEDLLEWAEWLKKADRKVAKDIIGESKISTIFLGLDYSFDEKPLLFETLVFGGKLSDEMDRYSTWDEAVSGHNAMVEKVKNA